MLVLSACGGGGGGSSAPPPAPVNVAPTSNAGPNQAVMAGDTVTLPGVGSDSDGTVGSFVWTQTAGTPTVILNDANNRTASFVAPNLASPTTFTFRLSVTDNKGATGFDSVNVDVSPAGGGGGNSLPSANADVDQSVVSGSAVNLAGSGSDPDGSVSVFTWQQTGGAAVALMNASTANASFTAPTVTANTVLSFSLTVTDNDGASAADSVNVTVTPPVIVNVSGRVTYDRVPAQASATGLNYGAIFQQPARGVTVQAVRGDGSQTVIASTVTDGDGNYSLPVSSNTSLFVRVRAEMVKAGAVPTWNFRVLDNTAGDALYSLTGATFNSGTASQTRNLNAPSGFSTSGVATGPRSAGPFAVLDSVYQSFQKVLEASPSAEFPALSISWSVNNRPASGSAPGTCPGDGNIGTSYYTNGTICLLGAANDDADEYDDHVIIHEWGHYFEDRFSRSDSVGGEHFDGDRLDLRLAFGEGFGNAWSGIVTDDPVYRDSSGANQSSGFFFSVEGNLVTNPGWYSEASVQSILYDLYDPVGESADSVSLGVTPIFNVLSGPQRTGVPLTSIFSFLTALKAANPGSAAGINALVNAQSINGTGIDAYGSAETNSAGDADALPVYTALSVNGGPANTCSTDTFGTGNKLGNWRFFRFSVSAAGNHTFTATGTGADAVMVLHQAGQIGPERDASFAPTEQFTANLASGDYVLGVAEFNNLDGGGGRVCMNVSVAR